MTTTSYNTPSWGRGRSAAGALLLLLVSAVLGVSNCQPLSVPSVPGPNPFIASSPGAIGPPQPAASSPPPVTPSPVVSAPSVAPVPTPEVGPDPCACTQTGLSGGINTTFIGCGQWLVANGSNAFVCFVVVSQTPSYHYFHLQDILIIFDVAIAGPSELPFDKWKSVQGMCSF